MIQWIQGMRLIDDDKDMKKMLWFSGAESEGWSYGVNEHVVLESRFSLQYSSASWFLPPHVGVEKKVEKKKTDRPVTNNKQNGKKISTTAWKSIRIALCK